MDNLPLEILDKLFSKLEIGDLCSVRLVRRIWNEVAVLSLRRLHGPIKFLTEAEVEKFVTIMENRIQLLPYSTFVFYLPFTGTTTTRPDIMQQFGICSQDSIPNNFSVRKNEPRINELPKLSTMSADEEEKEELRRGESVLNLLRYSPKVKLLKVYLDGNFRIPNNNGLEMLPVLEHLTRVKYLFQPKSYEARELLLEALVNRAPSLKELILGYDHDHGGRFQPPGPSIREDISKLPGLLSRLPISINFGIYFGIIYFDERYLDILREIVDIDRRFVHFKFFVQCRWHLDALVSNRIQGLLWEWLGKNSKSLRTLNVEWFPLFSSDVLPPILHECLALNLGVHGPYAASPDVRKCFPNLRRLETICFKGLNLLLSKLPKLEDLELFSLTEFQLFEDEYEEEEYEDEGTLNKLLKKVPLVLNEGPFGRMQGLKFLTVNCDHWSRWWTHDVILDLLRMLIISNRNWIHRLQRLYFRPSSKAHGPDVLRRMEEYRDLLSKYHDEVIVSHKPPWDRHSQLWNKKWRTTLS